jgi:hypothetical protein
MSGSYGEGVGRGVGALFGKGLFVRSRKRVTGVLGGLKGVARPERGGDPSGKAASSAGRGTSIVRLPLVGGPKEEGKTGGTELAIPEKVSK